MFLLPNLDVANWTEWRRLLLRNAGSDSILGDNNRINTSSLFGCYRKVKDVDQRVIDVPAGIQYWKFWTGRQHTFFLRFRVLLPPLPKDPQTSWWLEMGFRAFNVAGTRTHLLANAQDDDAPHPSCIYRNRMEKWDRDRHTLGVGNPPSEPYLYVYGSRYMSSIGESIEGIIMWTATDRITRPLFLSP